MSKVLTTVAIGNTAVAGEDDSAREAIFITWIEFLIRFRNPIMTRKRTKKMAEDTMRM